MNLMAYPSAEAGLSSGLQAGIQTGLAMRKQQQDEKTAEFQKQKYEESQKLEKAMKVITYHQSIATNKGMPKKTRVASMQAVNDIMKNELGYDLAPVADIGDDNTEKYINQLGTIFNAVKKGEIPAANAGDLLDAAKAEFASTATPEDMADVSAREKSLIDPIQQQSQAENYQMGLEAKDYYPEDPSASGYFAKGGKAGEKALEAMAKPGKMVEKTVDLGNEVEYIYTDGTREKIKKGVSPNTAIRIDTGEGTRDARFAMQLRKEFNQLQPVKDYKDVQTRFNVMTKAFDEAKKTKNFVAVDQALITLYNKMTDPQSVVRESEYVRTPQDMAWSARAKAAMQRVTEGGRLDASGREAIMTMATKFKDSYKNVYGGIVDEYKSYAVQAGISPKSFFNAKDMDSVSPQEVPSGRFTIKEIK